MQKLGIWLEKILFPGVLVNRRVRITLAGWFYLGLIFLFGMASINSGNNLLYLILSVMISLLLASFWLSEMVLNDFKLSRILPESVYAGEEFSIIYELTNQKRFFPLAGLEIIEKIDGKTARTYFLTVLAGKTEQAFTSLRLDKRGMAKFQELLVSTKFPFGFFEKTKRVNLLDQIIVMPYPAMMKFDPAQPGTQIGNIHTGKKGQGSELFGFRDYVPGDAPHSIAWKASARSGQILVKENEQDAENSLSIILKISLKRPKPDSIEREELIRKAFGLAKVYIEQGFRVRLLIQNRGIDFGAGLQQMKRLGIFLAMFDDEAEPDSGEELTHALAPTYECVLDGSAG